jgi:hypothetical protein
LGSDDFQGKRNNPHAKGDVMKIGVSLNIDVMKIAKAQLVQGKKGKYLNATIFIDVDNADQYGNHGMITQDLTKEEKDRGDKGPILGNGKVFWKADAQPTSYQQQQPNGGYAKNFQAPADDNFDDDVPF